LFQWLLLQFLGLEQLRMHVSGSGADQSSLP
jgi:hypothetical protein